MHANDVTLYKTYNLATARYAKKKHLRDLNTVDMILT